VDDRGVVHYGDHVPPEYADRDRDLLNTQGVAVGSEEGAPTAAEIAELERQAALDEQARQDKLEKARRDRVLLDTYNSVGEIEQLRDRRLDLLESQIRVTENYLGNLRERLAGLESEAAAFRPYNESPDAGELPEALAHELARAKASVDLYEQTLTRSRSEKAKLSEAFARDIERFRELKGG
jgi:hypothetical protein